jgi:hypothetical protein
VRSLAFLTAALACLLVFAGAALAGYPDAFTAVKGNPADKLARLPVDDYSYDRAKRCTKGPQKGTLALKSWLDRHAGGSFWGIMRCEKLGKGNYSLHADGRAIDWHLDAATAAGKREARRIISLLLAPDKAGNPHALARRMGVQGIIWDCKSWWSGSEGMGNYSVCYDKKGRRKKRVNKTLAHRDHIHFEMNRAGAKKSTSFWTRKAPRVANPEPEPEPETEPDTYEETDAGTDTDGGLPGSNTGADGGTSESDTDSNGGWDWGF